MIILRVMNRLLAQMEKMVLAVGIIALSLLVSINVLTRLFFNWSWVGVEEICAFIVIWVTFLGTSMAARKGIHITMDALFEKMPKKMKKTVYMGIALITAALASILTVFGWQFMHFTYKVEQVSAALMMPVWVVYMSFPIGFFLTTIHFTRVFIRNLKEERLSFGPEEEEEKECLNY